MAWDSRKRPRPATAPLTHTFDVDPEDHCETPGAAYDDIVPALSWLAETLQKPKHMLAIWDPYFCAGAVVKNLGSRGFPLVHNRNEDFYKVIADGREPDFDVLVTNPPYSGDHLERLLRFCANCNKSWFLLLPNYVYVNPYYAATVGSSIKESLSKHMNLKKTASKATAQETAPLSTSVTPPSSTSEPAPPFFLVPHVRYEYIVPPGVRQEEREVKTAPFLSFWYASMPRPLSAKFIKHWRKLDEAQERAAPSSVSRGVKVVTAATALPGSRPRPILAGHPNQLPHNMRAQYDPTRRRLRKKQREAFSRNKRADEIAKEEARTLALASQPCRFGAACTRPGCWFAH